MKHSKTRSLAVSDSHLFYLNCYYSVRESRYLFQGLSTTAGIGVISSVGRCTWSYMYPSCQTTLTAIEGKAACVISSQKNEVVRYIRLKRPNPSPKVKQHFIESLIV